MVKAKPDWLPKGYVLENDTSLLYLLREADGSVVAVFSTLGATRADILEEALKDGPPRDPTEE